MSAAYRAAIRRYLYLDAPDERVEVQGSRLDLLLFVVGILTILTIVAASSPVPA